MVASDQRIVPELISDPSTNSFLKAVLYRCHLPSTESLELTRTMIVFGADINKTNDKGETPRHLAASSPRQGVVGMNEPTVVLLFLSKTVVI